MASPTRLSAGDRDAVRYVQRSEHEFSDAQGIWVETKSGRFRDPSRRCVASGKPVLVQEISFSENLAEADARA